MRALALGRFGNGLDDHHAGVPLAIDANRFLSVLAVSWIAHLDEVEQEQDAAFSRSGFSWEMSSLYSSAADAERALNRYSPPGAAVTVWVDPPNPAEAVCKNRCIGSFGSICCWGAGWRDDTQRCGLFPILITPAERTRFHGIDERLSIENLRLGVEVTYRVLERMTQA